MKMSKEGGRSYKEYDNFLLAVDCIVFSVIENKLSLLVFERELEPLAGEWSLLGDFVMASESVAEAASRVMTDLTGVDNSYMEQLHSFGERDRDPGGRVISVAYWSLMKVDESRSGISKEGHKTMWVEVDRIPELILDHKKMVSMAINRLRERARFYPIGFELVPREFTLLQLLKVYEAIFDRKIDDRNFRKKILKSGMLVPLNKKDKSTSRKGSYLYSFDQAIYGKLQDQGYNFEF